MACITLTRVTLARSFATMPTPGWEVAYEGQLVATYAEEASGRLRQVGSSRLDAVLRGPASAWGPAVSTPTSTLSEKPTCCGPAPGKRERRPKARFGVIRHPDTREALLV